MPALVLAMLTVALSSALAAWVKAQAILYLSAAFGLAAACSMRSLPKTSAFFRVVAGYFATAYVVCGSLALLNLALAPRALPGVGVSDAYVMTMAMFACIARALFFLPAVRKVLDVADRYFRADDVAFRFRIFARSIVVRERLVAAALMVCVLALNQMDVALAVRMSYTASAMTTSLQTYDQARFWHVILIESPCNLAPWLITWLATSMAAQVLSMRWRTWLTDYYEERWLGDHRHYQLTLAGTGADNPDQRIQEDVGLFIGQGQTLGLYDFTMTFIRNLSSLISFAVVLWALSSGLLVPGLLFWFAVLYAMLGTGIVALIGRALASLSFARQHYESNYRFGLARLREYSEQIALLGGEPAERVSLRQKFRSIARNFYQIMWVRTRLQTFSSFFGEVNYFIPYIALGALFFTHKRTMGDLTQTAFAFASVTQALTTVITNYNSMAEFRSVQNRLVSFDSALAGIDARRRPAAALRVQGDRFSLADVVVEGVDGQQLFAIANERFELGENVMITGPSGAGKSTLLRVLSGVWPHWTGTLDVPDDATVLALPQKPYIPAGTLRAALSYPRTADHYDTAAILEALSQVELQPLMDLLDIDDNWPQRLSGGEQQRVAIARALLAKPAWLLLDEATSAMDPGLEQRIYAMLADVLPATTLISVGHRESLFRFHRRRVTIDRASVESGDSASSPKSVGFAATCAALAISTPPPCVSATRA